MGPCSRVQRQWEKGRKAERLLPNLSILHSSPFSPVPVLLFPILEPSLPLPLCVSLQLPSFLRTNPRSRLQTANLRVLTQTFPASPSVVPRPRQLPATKAPDAITGHPTSSDVLTLPRPVSLPRSPHLGLFLPPDGSVDGTCHSQSRNFSQLLLRCQDMPRAHRRLSCVLMFHSGSCFLAYLG